MKHDNLQEKRNIILKMASKHGIQNVRVIGSAARQEDESENILNFTGECGKRTEFI